MQRVKPNLMLQLIATPLFLVGDFILVRYYPALSIKFYGLHWLFVLFLLGLAFTPLARKALVANSNEKPRFKYSKCLALIGLFELSLMAVFAGMVQLIQCLQPEFAENFSMLNTQWALHWGLFPWAAIAFLACAFAYYAYLKKQDAFMSTLTYPLFKSSAHQTLGITSNVCARLNTTLVLVSSLMMASLSLAWLVTHFLSIRLLFGLNLESIISVTLMLVVVGHGKLGARLFDTLLQRGWSVVSVLLSATLLVAFMLVVISYFFEGFNWHRVELPHWLVDQAPIEASYALFLALWALAWSSIAGVFVAYVSRGHNMLQIMAAVLALPLCGVLLTHTISFDAPILYLVLGLIGTVILIYLLMHHDRAIASLMQIYVAGDDEIKHRAHRKFVINLIRMTAGLLYLYLPGGILLLAIVSVMYTWPNMIYLLFVLMASGSWFFRKN